MQATKELDGLYGRVTFDAWIDGNDEAISLRTGGATEDEDSFHQLWNAGGTILHLSGGWHTIKAQCALPGGRYESTTVDVLVIPPIAIPGAVVALILVASALSKRSPATATLMPPLSELARQVEVHPRIILAPHNVTHPDVRMASPQDNIRSVVANQPARRSETTYTDGARHGPGGTTPLCRLMLQGMLKLAEKYTFSVSSIAGGVHGGKGHYAGRAFDVNAISRTVDGTLEHVDLAKTTHHFDDFRKDAEALGATVFNPTNKPKDHARHIHVEWSEKDCPALSTASTQPPR